MKFSTIAQKRTELQTTPGSTIKFLRYSSLTGKADLAETDVIVPDSFSTSLLSITVTEHAKAVSVTELLLRQSADNVLDRVATVLGMHYAREYDRLVRDSLLTAPTTLFAKGKASRALLGTNDTYDVNLIRDAVEMLAPEEGAEVQRRCLYCLRASSPVPQAA